MTEAKLSIPLNAGFRFLHEPHCSFTEKWYIGRSEEIDEFVQRLQYSNGGSFLVTGYRGVGKTSFVNKALSILGEKATVLDVHLNLARPALPAELMHLIVRHLYERLIEKDIYRTLSAELQKSITLAYQRTSANVVRKLSHNTEQGFEAGDFSLHGMKIPLVPKLNLKRSRTVDLETSFIAYDDKSAEHDIIEISRALAFGVLAPQSLNERIRSYFRRVKRRRVPLKVVFVFDEMDKLDEVERSVEGAAPKLDSVEDMLSGLKTLFTTSGICFVFIAGKDLHEKWVRDLRRGDGIYESIFSYDKYLPCMWSDMDEICDRFSVEDSKAEGSNSRELLAILKQYLRFMGRGMPRRFLRHFNVMVRWKNERPEIPFGNDDLRRVTFFARLNEMLEANGDQLFGIASEDTDGTRHDRRKLGVYYVVDWILRTGKSDFSVTQVLAASRELSSRIAFAHEVASGAITTLIAALVKADYIELVPPRLDDMIINVEVAAPEERYRLTARRLAELSGIPLDIDDDIATPPSGTMPPKQAGALRIGRFVTEEVLGRGGMGTVYKALDPMRKRHVALKVIHDSQRGLPDQYDRFLREIKILEDLRHDNIVRFLEAGEADSFIYFTMDLIEGSDLRLILGSLRHLSPEIALAILMPIGNAISFAHRNGYFRLDLKPGNIQVSYSGQVYLMDLGIAKGIESDQSITKTQEVIGTLAYMAPEQFTNDRVDMRADIYSYGAVLYEVLTGSPPFSGAEVVNVMMKHLNESPAPLSEKALGIPGWLDELVMQCLEKDPSARFQCMDDLLNKVSSFIGAVPTSLEIGNLAQKARQKDVKLENSRNARTFQGPGSFTALFQNLSAHPSADAGEFTRLLKGLNNPPIPVPTAVTSTPHLLYGEPTATQLIFSLKDVAQTKIGSALDNDIVLEKEDVSRYHAQIDSEGGHFLLLDLNSSKGTYFNGERILRPQELSPNDRFRIGTTFFTLIA